MPVGHRFRRFVETLKGPTQAVQTAARCKGSGETSVVTWGRVECGGDSSQVQEQLTNVLQIQSTYRAFAAILESGAVVTWGDADLGGDSTLVQEQLKKVQCIQASRHLGLCRKWRRQQPGTVFSLGLL